ncbi:hypothetical protein CROQUDRAFT_100568 [Cronartium quercuum f. sp. fusiforme G11]|uniref:Uncharacterized protein n=1 Tax=Cronartium quercuum f. sp. fusiforme G11 TaxID=708437 RepID=A0A9P6T610_9BASI|nr:hypothetical protein CROQUDRAFT_100568 [Cronartium quercuum f. sp. fusiforme G11]
MRLRSRKPDLCLPPNSGPANDDLVITQPMVGTSLVNESLASQRKEIRTEFNKHFAQTAEKLQPVFEFLRWDECEKKWVVGRRELLWFDPNTTLISLPLVPIKVPIKELISS